MKTRLSLIITFFTSVSVVFSQIPIENLVAYFPLDMSAEDATDNGNHGIIFGNISSTSNRFGEKNKALIFDGETSYIDIPSNELLNISQEISISVWINPSSITDQFFTGLVNKWLDTPGPGGIGYYLGINPSGFEVRWNTGSVNTDGGIIPIDTWTNIIVTYNSDHLNIYRNCVLEASVPAVDTIQNTDSPLRLGFQSHILPGGSTGIFDGIMDEVLIYDRALSVLEVEQICSFNPTNEEELNAPRELVVFPNPFNEVINWNDSDLDIKSIEILNVKGEIILKDASITHSFIQTTNLPSGIYVIKMYTENGIHLSRKVIKM
jgi:hypothetical protein